MSEKLDLLQSARDWWQELTTGGLGAALSAVGIHYVKAVRKLDKEKADKEEVVRMFEMLDERMEREFERARQDRKAISDKVDGYMATQNAINLQLMDRTRRTNGNH